MNKREHAFSHWLFYILAALVLAACGGGGGDKLLPLQGVSGYTLGASLTNGANNVATISPSGSATVKVTLTTPTGAPASGQTVTLGVSGPASLNATAIVTNAQGIATATLTGTGSTSGSGAVSAVYIDSNGNAAKSSVAYSILNGDNVVLTANKSQVKSGAGDSVILTAFITDSSGNARSNMVVPAQFFKVQGGGSGFITNAGIQTDSNGLVTATYNPDTTDRSNKTVTITATTASAAQGTVDINVVGTTIKLQTAQSSVTIGDPITISGTLADGNAVAIANASISITSANFGSPVTLTTDSLGQFSTSTTVSATDAGSPNKLTFTATGQGATGTLVLNVSTTSFKISTPASDGTELTINTAQTIQVTYLNGVTPVSGKTVNFSSSIGTLSAASAVTDGAGKATVTLNSTFAGQANIVATSVVPASGSTPAVTLQATRNALFVATTPSQIALQAGQTTVAPGGQTEIFAVVRDVANNPVKNQTVNFNAVSDPSSGPGLSSPSAITDAAGRASVTYTAGSATTATNSVEIQAWVGNTTYAAATVKTQHPPSTPSNARLTVGGRSVFIGIGTGNTISEVNSTIYADPYNVLITDFTGAPIANQTVVLTVTPTFFYKGQYVLDITTNQYVIDTTTYTSCPNEDANLDGQINAGEDKNHNGFLDPGSPVTLSSSVVKTDANGFANFSVVYGKSWANWVQVDLKATTTVEGTESTSIRPFILPVLAKDVTHPTPPPGGMTSPWGSSTNCNDVL